MFSSTGEALVLGVVQGLTEFLPISSDGHLALTQMLLQTSEPSLTVTVMLHVGTLLATALILRARLVEVVKGALGAARHPSLFSQSPTAHDALFVVVASVPTACIGLALRDLVAALTVSPFAIAMGFLVTGALLISSRWAPAGSKDQASLVDALLIGTAQGLAVLPGVSRSGSTIVLALWLGIRPERAFELSMLLSLPAVFGAVALEARHLDEMSGEIPFAVLGAATAFVVGLFALHLLRRSLVRGFFPWFALWVVPLAFVIGGHALRF